MNEKILAALMAEKDIAAKVRGVYHLVSPHGCRYPNIVYSIISDVPALHGDNIELQSRVTVRIHIVTKDGRYEEIYLYVNRIMLNLGFMRVQAIEQREDDLKAKIVDYRTGVDFDV